MRYIFGIILTIILLCNSPVYATDTRIFGCNAGTQGETTGTLDNRTSGSPDNLVDGEAAFVYTISGTTVTISWYIYDADSVVAESDPITVRPKDFNDPSEPGVWLLTKVSSSSMTSPKVSGTAGTVGVYEGNSTDTSVSGFKGADSISDDMWYVFPDNDPSAYDIWTFSNTTSNESDISLSKVYDAIEFVIDGGGSEIADNVQMDIELPFGFIIERATLLADQTGSIVIDVWVDSYANYPPDNGDTITSATPPTISSDVKSQDSSLSGWTSNLTAGSIIRINVDSCTDIEKVTLSLKGYRTF